jgi:lysophospholipase L1-like esterase
MKKKLIILCGFISISTIHLPAQDAAQPQTTIPSDGNSTAHADWYGQCEGRVATMKGKPCDVIFIGDSITQNFQDEPPSGWDLVGGPVWKKHYGKINALDFGVGADGTEHVLWRLDHMDIKDFTPKVAVILIGTNDTQFPAEDIAAGVKAVIAKTQATFHGVKIILLSILPTSRNTQKVIDANKIIETFGDNQTVFYFDLGSKMTPIGDNWKGVGHDHLHLSPIGYELWASEMEPLLAQLLPSYAATVADSKPDPSSKPLLSSQDAVAGVKATSKGKATVYAQTGEYGGFGGSDALPAAATDGDASTKYLNQSHDGSNNPGINSGLVVTPKVGSSIVTSVLFTAANDVPDRDPTTFTLEGSNDADAMAEGAKGFTLIYEGTTGMGQDPGRGNPGDIVKFTNATAYKTYRILITSIRSQQADSVQYAEIQLFGTIASSNGTATGTDKSGTNGERAQLGKILGQ